MLLMLLAVLVAALAMSALLRCPVPVAAPTAIFVVVLVLFAFGAVDLLFVGLVLTVVLSVVGAAYGVVARWRAGGLRNVISWVFAPATVVYLLMLSVFGLASRGLMFSSWDEFSHWGRVVSAMVSSDALPPYASADLLFASYPPALPIWEYFLTRMQPSFVESHVFIAHHAMALALLLPFASQFRWRQPARLLFLTVTATLLMTSFFTLDAVLIDPVLAMTFGYCLAIVLLGSRDVGSIWRHLGPALAVLALLKDTGVLFALIVVVVLTIRVGLGQRLLVRLGRGRTWRVPSSLGHGAAGLACVLVPTVIWRVILDLTETRSTWEGGTSVGGALADLAQNGSSYRRDTTTSFITALQDQPLTSIPVPLAFWGWFALALLLLVLTDHVRVQISSARPVEKGTNLLATTTLLAGSLVYVVAMWLTYMTAFTEYEATNLASFARYLGGYWLAVVFVCVAVALASLGSRTTNAAAPGFEVSRVHTVVVLAVLLSVGNIANVAVVLTRQHVGSAAAVRAPYSATAAAARDAGIAAGDSVWILDEHTTGFGYHVLSYELVDSHTTGWSVGPLKDEADVWTQDLTVDQWANALMDMDYLLIHHTEPAFVERFASLFEDPTAIEDRSVFAVEPDGAGSVRLVEVTG
ncbi:hypothetical protein [Nocardioides hwasunensis]|uniref:Uncharacterized protein n=1 Tax=Nocardioides hwasunensis TaxID=397258 RepID=A0ABR8MGT4_9ACTN|nr:hypothetical protein [Nocardioides hwasunensis]MBD3914476.1 hypothetical protein [Nocardioides hwasunensis]